jgi:hypothetical protein
MLLRVWAFIFSPSRLERVLATIYLARSHLDPVRDFSTMFLAHAFVLFPAPFTQMSNSLSLKGIHVVS